MEINVVQKVLKVNDELAQQVRERLRAAGVVAVNLISAPGSGKTTLLETSIPLLRDKLRMGVIEGDPETTRDAERIARHDVPVTQINTAGGCHLEANLVLQALDRFDLDALDILFIENVGNMVCPVGFDLGETRRAALVSVPEGHDKPAKYPKLFRQTDLVILNKIDLAPYMDFDETVFDRDLKHLNPDVQLLRISCRTGEGLDGWTGWIRRLAEAGEAAEVNA